MRGMTRRKGIYDWENEPAGGRRVGYDSTVASGWHQSAQSTFAEPSRHEHRRRRQRRREQGRLVWLAVSAFGICLALGVALLALWPTLARYLHR